MLRRAAPRIFDLLRDSPSLEAARENLFTYISNREKTLFFSDNALHPLEHATARECVRVLKSLIAPRHETRAGFSTLETLWRFVRSDDPEATPVAEGFVLEFVHLFRGLSGESGLVQGWLGPALAEAGAELVDFNQLEGRRAGVARSDFLDQAAAHMWARVSRHPTGLDPEVVARRRRNAQAIIDFFDATPAHWESFAWQLAHVIQGPEAVAQLEQLIPMTPAEKDAVRLAVENGIPFGITPYYLSLFDFDSASRREDAQVRAQVIPPLHYVRRMIEHKQDREFAFDFMHEHDTSPIDLVTRRYASIAILKPIDTCPQICVYCQRNWEIAGPMEASGFPAREKLDAALDWFAAHPELREVLVTGGDPFFLSDRRIKHILDRLAAMDHITNIRFGTRALVTLPMRVTDDLADLLSRYIAPGRRNVSVVTHIESAAEVTPEMADAAYRLRSRGLHLYNQQVFTLHTSRRFQAVANRVAMKKIGVDPYYTFYPKGKEETRDYVTPLARILQERKEEARLLPGMFRTDEPVFNVPRLGKNHVRARQDRELIAIRPDGRRVYLWHPWEKGIMPTEPWLYVDNGIHRYLEQLQEIGEDPAEYASIWYYY